jgi:hypothetical protein
MATAAISMHILSQEYRSIQRTNDDNVPDRRITIREEYLRLAYETAD